MRRSDIGLVTRRVEQIDHVATGRLMREARKSLGISLREMARRMDVSAPFLSDLESGQRNWTAARIEQWWKVKDKLCPTP